MLEFILTYSWIHLFSREPEPPKDKDCSAHTIEPSYVSTCDSVLGDSYEEKEVVDLGDWRIFGEISRDLCADLHMTSRSESRQEMDEYLFLSQREGHARMTRNKMCGCKTRYTHVYIYYWQGICLAVYVLSAIQSDDGLSITGLWCTLRNKI